MQQSKTNWSPVWVGISVQGGANMAYIAQNQTSSQQYAVVIRGTDFGMSLDKQEDMDVETTQNFTVGNNTVQIATGTATGHELVIGAQGTDNNTLLQELQGLVGTGTGAALYLQNALPEATFQVYTFAGPTAGLTDFAALFDSTFPSSGNDANSSWRVYNAWDIVPQAWEHDTLQEVLTWYPSPGPVCHRLRTRRSSGKSSASRATFRTSSPA